MQRVIITLFLLVLSLIQNPAWSAMPLSFPVARDWLYERSDKLKSSDANIRSKQENENSLKMLGGPTVSLDAFQIAGQKKIDLGTNVPISIPGLGSMNVPVGMHEKFSLNGPRASATATWPIYTGGQISAKQAASKYEVDEAIAQKRSDTEELDAQLAGHYFGLQLAVSLERLQKSMLSQQDRELARAKKFEKQGVISKLERMSVQVARDNRNQEYLKAKNNAKVAKLQLARLLHEEDFGELSTPLFVLKRPLEPLKYWTDIAVVSNPQIAIIQAKADQAAQGVKASKGAWHPKVFAFGTYNFIKHYQSLVEPNWIAGIGINFTLWDAKDRRASVRSAEATLESAVAGKSEAINQVKTAVEVAWTRTQNAIEQYKLSASNVTLALQNLKLKQKSFGEGLSTSLDVTEARNQLLAAEVGRRLAAFEFVSNYAILHAVCGQMSEFMNAVNNHQVIVEK